MDTVCKFGHKSLFLKLSTNFVSVQDNPSETSVSSFQMSTYILNCMFQLELWGAKKRRLVQVPQAPFKAPIHSKCCIGGFRETGLALVIVLRCDWPLCDIWFKSYEHFKIKMFLSVHTAGPWWIFQPKFYTFRVKSAPFKKAPGKKVAPFRRLCAFFHLGALRCQQL